MINDIFATSMGGTYQRREGDRIIETGSWGYRGFGNAEIELKADGEMPNEHLKYSVTIHSAELQLGDVRCRSVWRSTDGEETRELSAVIAGKEVRLNLDEGDGRPKEGTWSVPDETIYTGPSPIWLIHLCMTALPPHDRQVTTPVISFDAMNGVMEGGFFRIARTGPDLHIDILDTEGRLVDHRDIHLADDGCPVRITGPRSEIEIVRLPEGGR